MTSIDVLADAAMLLLIDQRQAYGLWHIQTCGFLVGDFNASHCPLKVTDQKLYDRNEWIDTGVSVFKRRAGCRLMTVTEAAEYHRSLECWPECRTAQDGAVGGWTRHILKPCTVRCKATRDVLDRIAETMNVSIPTLRKLAGRRHNLGKYAEGTKGFPVPSKSRVEARRREKKV